MKYWAFVFFLSLGTFGLSGFLYFKIHGQPVSTTNAPPVVLASEDDIELLFTGDIMLSRSVESKMRERGDYAYPFRLIAEATRGADITFGNLEGPISDQGAHQGSIYSFRADPRVLAGLNFAGFDVLSLANNHIWDWGVDALLDTVRLLKEAGISSVGAGKNQEEADKPAVFCVAFGSSASKLGKPSSPGCRFRVAFLAYTNLYPEGLIAGEDSPGISDPRLENIRKRVGDAREEADIVIVSFHWGEEYKTESNDIQKKLARAMVRAGADLVIGHHPHVAQEVEKYKNGWIAYSLGNFVFDQDFSEETMRGAMARVLIRDKKIFSFKLIPIRLNDAFQPYVVE